tara:strand:+ start:2555 stop:2656 length:102 start_codon:yes stop_codon:yes gene_type:complete
MRDEQVNLRRITRQTHSSACEIFESRIIAFTIS